MTRLSFVFAVTLTLAGCGARSGLDGPSPDSGSPPMPDASPLPQAPQPCAPRVCTPQPATGVTIATFPPAPSVEQIALVPVGSAVYVATSTWLAQAFAGAITEAPMGGGAAQSIMAPAFNVGSLTSDGTRLYYPQTVCRGLGNNSFETQVTGLASVDLATHAVRPIPTGWQPSAVIPGGVFGSDSFTTELVASCVRPGLFWLGGLPPTGVNYGGTALYAWDPQSDTNSTVATGEDLVGLALDDTNVYWADSRADQLTLYAAPIAGGPPTALATAAATHGGSALLGASSTRLVFMSDFSSGSIQAVGKQGGAVEQVLSNPFVVAAVDEEYLYWVDHSQATLQRRPLGGGAAQVVWRGDSSTQVRTVAFDACNVYVGVTKLVIVDMGTYSQGEEAISVIARQK
jgi:hypothetical protein